MALVGSIVLIGAFFLALARAAASPVVNADTFFHLRIGHEFLSGWTPAAPGAISSFGTADWVPTQWLGQAGLAAVEAQFGLAGVAVLTSIVILLFAAVLFATARRHGSFIVAALLTPVAVIACSPALSGRPQVLSYLFIALVTSSWIAVSGHGKAPWWTVPLTWLWAMLHGMWPVGVVIGFAAAIGLALDREHSPRRRLQFFAVPVLSALAAGLTPVGPAIYGAVAKVTGISDYFAEWAAPELTQFPNVLGVALLGVVALLGLRSVVPLSWFLTALIALAALLLVHSNRTVPPAVVMLVPLAAHLISGRWNRHTPTKKERVGLACGFVTALALTIMWSSNQGEDPRAEGAARLSVAALPAGTPLLNTWDDGGYDMWRYPDLDLALHGYGDMFTDDEIASNHRLISLEPGWYDIIEKAGFRHALLFRDGALAHELQDKGWTVVAEDALSDEFDVLTQVHLAAPEVKEGP